MAFFNSLFRRAGRHDLYSYQVKELDNRAPFTIINKSRQIGISSFYGAWALYMAIVHDARILVISPSERQSKEFKGYTDEFWRAWKEWDEIPQPRVKDDNTQELRFEEGGRVLALPNKPNTVRGKAADIIIADELAHFLNGSDREVFEAITPSISRGGRFVGISTPFGEGNLFHEIWSSPSTDAKWNKVLIPHTECPDLDAEAIRASGAYDEQSFAQEFCNEFIGSADSEFPMSLILGCVNAEAQYCDIEQLRDKPCVGGYDVARDRDLSAVHIYECLPDGRRALRCKYVWAGVKYTEQKARLKEYLAIPRMLSFKMDDTANKEIAEDLEDSFPFVRGYAFTNELKAKMVGNLKMMYERKQLEIPDDAVLMRAINSIKRKYSETNYLKFDAKREADTGHADEFWAQALALYEGGEDDIGCAMVQDPRSQRGRGNWWR